MARPNVFVDTNTLLSGIFFSGLENILLNLYSIELATADVCVNELFEVAKRKYSILRAETEKVALEEIELATKDIQVAEKSNYEDKLETAKNLIGHKNDRLILAAALSELPDYFVTGDAHFHKKKVKELLNVVRTREALEALGVLPEREE